MWWKLLFLITLFKQSSCFVFGWVWGGFFVYLGLFNILVPSSLDEARHSQPNSVKLMLGKQSFLLPSWIHLLMTISPAPGGKVFRAATGAEETLEWSHWAGFNSLILSFTLAFFRKPVKCWFFFNWSAINRQYNSSFRLYSVFWQFMQSCNQSCNQGREYFHHLKKILHAPLQSIPSPTLAPGNQRSNFYFCLFQNVIGW